MTLDPNRLNVFTTLDHNDEGDAGIGVIAPLDLSEVTTAMAPTLGDPDGEFVTAGVAADVVPRPGVASPTVGPHRYTIYVPHDDGSRLNLGTGLGNVPNGISLDTRTHIHLYAYHQVPTYLNLGGMPDNFLGWCTAGYNLYTEGFSGHVSKLQLHMASQDQGMVLQAKQAMSLYSSDSDIALEAGSGVTLNGKKKVAITAGVAEPINASTFDTIMAVALTGADIADFGAGSVAGIKGGDAEQKTAVATAATGFAAGFAPETASKLRDQWVAAASGHVDKALGHIATVVGLILSFKKTWKEPKKGATAWEVKSAKIQYAISAASEIKSLYSDYVKAKDPEEPGGITMNAESTISLDAKGSVSINGVKGVAVTGFKGAAVSGLTASLKGHKEGTVWGGLGASVKALAGDVAIASDLKGATVKGKKDVEMSSEAGKATVSGNDDTQINSQTAKMFVHGVTHTYVGAGKGAGMGIVAKPSQMTIGKMANADTFANAAGDNAYSVMRMLDSSIGIQVGTDTRINMTKSQIQMKTGKVEIKSTGDVTINGSVVKVC